MKRPVATKSHARSHFVKLACPTRAVCISKSLGRALCGWKSLVASCDEAGRYLRIISRCPIRLRFFGVLVEETCISCTSTDGRHVWRINILLGKSLPSDLCKPRVVHDILAASVQVTQSLRQVGCDELAKQILCVRVDVRWVLDAALEDVFVDFERRARIPERCETCQHLKDENAQTPPTFSQYTQFKSDKSMPYQSTLLL